MIDDVLEFWFGTPATTAEEYGKQIKRWYMGGPELDAEIRERFGALVVRAIAGELDDWAHTIRGRLALVILLDQFTRSVYRNDPRTYAGDSKAQALASDAFINGWDRELSIAERNMLAMPLVHAEDLEMQERGVEILATLAAEAPEWKKPFLAMGVEQTQKYRDIISRFGRFPHRNKILGRANTPDEETFLVDWHQKMPPSGAAKL